MRLLGAGGRAQAALHAVLLDEAQLRLVGVVGQRAPRGRRRRSSGTSCTCRRRRCRLPNGRAGGGSAIASAARGACASRWSSARSSVARLSACTANGAGRATPCAGARCSAASSAARSRASRACEQPQVLAGDSPGPLRIACATAICSASACAVLGRFLVGHQHPDLAGAVGDGRQPEVDADAGGVPHGHRQHARRHAVHGRVDAARHGPVRRSAARRRASLCSSSAASLARRPCAVGRAAACAGARPGRRASAWRSSARRSGTPWCRRRSRRTGAARRRCRRPARPLRRSRRGRWRPQPAAGLALERGVAADRARRADVDAGGAADLLVAAVRAELGLVVEELRLLELAHQLAQLQHGVEQLALVARRRGGSPAAAGASRRPASAAGRAPGRSVSSSVCGARSKSIAPAASQTRTQSRWLLQRSRSTW